MKIIVCIKQVPEVSEIQFDPVRKTIIREGVTNVVNPFDRRAVTQAVEIRKKFGGEVCVITMGPPQAKEALFECLAMGADKGVHLVDTAFAGADTLATARALSLAIKKGGFDVVFCGKYSVDAETGQVGPEVAELLGIPHITGLTGLEIDDRGKVKAERETDEGFETIECNLPVLFTTAERLVRPIKVKDESQIEGAKKKPLKVVTASDLSSDTSIFGLSGSPTYVSDITTLRTKREGIMMKSKDPNAVAEKLTQYLLERGLFGRWEEEAAAPQLPKGNKKKFVGGRAVWVVAEIIRGRLRSVTLELLGKGVELADKIGGELAAVLVGKDVASHVRTLCAYGADEVYIIEHDALSPYTADGYTNVLTQAITTYKPYIILIPSTANGRDFAPRIAARLGLGLTGDCVGLDIDTEGRLIQLKPAFGGNIVAPILSRTVPQMATVRPGMLKKIEPDWSRKPVVDRINPVNPGNIRTKVIETQLDVDESAVELDSAEVVVTVGAGIGGPENLPIVRELAKVLDAAIGATRRVVDYGWLPRQHQVGLTGKAIAPKLYIGVGVRGAFNHLIGIQRSQIIVGINKDPEAEIFNVSNYGVIGDFAEVVPALTRALVRAKK